MSSIRTTAEKIVNERRKNVLTDIFWNEFTDAITQALRDERERAAKILEKRVAELKSVTHPTTHNTSEQLDLADLITKIRKDEG